MTTRVFSNISNLPIAQAEGKRMTRATRKVLGELPVHNQQKPQNTLEGSGKENVVDNMCKGQKKVRQTKVAARRLNLVQPDEVPMEVEQVEELAISRVLPFGVKDIDADDAANPQLCSEYAFETFAYLKQLEKRGSVKPEYLSGCPTSDKMRAVLVDWLVEVQIQFKLLQETLFLTVNTIDRFLAVEGKDVHRSRLQLVGVAAMFLISKIEEVYAPAVSDFVYITDNAYTEAEIRHMELKIIRALDFDLCQPISLNFLRRYSKAGDVDVLQHSLAKYTLEVCLLDYNLVHIPGSLLASSSLCMSLLVLDPSTSMDTVWTPTLEFYSGYTAEDVLDVVTKLATNMVKMNRSNKLQAVRNKYKSGKFMKVADLGELKGEKIFELAGSK
eukprot:TRINITY_DN16797_c0_g1_i1.p1 TRINITY_DN16797_c0_g1~~TRINITY_DN16797_c0_g1_i1.p1  ORF type:complete len:386 (-),score=115.13 TRINITY_DN16797_c0_g1_i1:224-1381(-)